MASRRALASASLFLIWAADPSALSNLPSAANLAMSAAVGTPHFPPIRPPEMRDTGPAMPLSISPNGELHTLSLQRADCSGVRQKKLHRFRAGAAGTATGTAGTS